MLIFRLTPRGFCRERREGSRSASRSVSSWWAGGGARAGALGPRDRAAEHAQRAGEAQAIRVEPLAGAAWYIRVRMARWAKSKP